MNTQEILAAFPKRSALVVGDICLDRWCTYDPALSEASRETGLPRLAVVKTELTPGGGGTVAGNLAALNIGRVAVLGAIGNDGHGHELIDALNSRRISPELLVRSGAIATFTYTKLLNAQTGDEDRPRVDFVNCHTLPEDVEAGVVSRLKASAADFDVIFVADQAETKRGGVVTSAVRDALAEIARQFPEKLIWVDSRVRAALFRRVIIKANQQEADSASASLSGYVDYAELRRRTESKLLFVTLGERGVLVIDEQGQTLVPTRAVAKPVDICGAGDSFSAGAAMALAITGCPVTAARFGNLVSSVTIMKKGTGTASPEELLASDAHTRD